MREKKKKRIKIYALQSRKQSSGNFAVGSKAIVADMRLHLESLTAFALLFAVQLK